MKNHWLNHRRMKLRNFIQTALGEAYSVVELDDKQIDYVVTSIRSILANAGRKYDDGDKCFREGLLRFANLLLLEVRDALRGVNQRKLDLAKERYNIWKSKI